MGFSKISITKKSVDLSRETKDANGAVEEVHLNSPEYPLSTFRDALQAFAPFVVELLEIPESWRETLTITTLNLSADKNGHRGLIVTAIRPIPKAYDKPLVMNTPLVREGGEDPSPDAFVLSDVVLDLIALAESEATRYANGERVQTELFPKAETKSDNATAFDDRAAAAEVASTRKPGRKKKPVDFVRGVGAVVNAESTELLDDAGIRQLLLQVERVVEVDQIARWTSSERNLAVAWADVRLKEMVTGKLNKPPIVEPECVRAAATVPLSADKWTGPKPMRMTDEAAAAIRDARA